MPRQSKAIVERAKTNRLVLQTYIMAKFGLKKLGKAQKRLCLNCNFYGKCLLLPLTTKGEDCPYFSKKAKL